jgi:hypothetical protein
MNKAGLKESAAVETNSFSTDFLGFFLGTSFNKSPLAPE